MSIIIKNKWLITTICATVFLFVLILWPSPANAIVQSTGGDGFVPIIYQDKVFNIFHHKTPGSDPNNPEYSINCVVRKTGQECAGYPRYFSTTPGSSGRLGIGTPGTANIYTSTFTHAVIEGSRLFYAASTSTNNGIGCFDLDLGVNCNGTSFFNLGSLGANGLPGLAAKVDGVERVGSKVYSIGSDIAMYCLDITNALSPTTCSGQPYPVNTGIEAQMPAYDGPTFLAPREVINNRIYFSVQYFNQGSPAAARLTCFDPLTNTRCVGWNGATASAALGTGGDSYHSIFSDRTTLGVPNAVCAGAKASDPVLCYDLLSGSTTSSPAIFSMVPPGANPLNKLTEEVVVGTKMYMAFPYSLSSSTQSATICWDFAAQAGCSGFGSSGYRAWDGSTGGGNINGGDTRDYGYTALGTCILGLGDAGVLWSFDSATGSLPGDESCALGPQCFDGGDNDGDGAIDFPADTGCSSLADTTELLLVSGSSNFIPGLPKSGVKPKESSVWPLGLIGLSTLIGVFYLVRNRKSNIYFGTFNK